MSESQTQEAKFGKIGWVDLTVTNADQVRDFYSQVTGWQSEGIDMGGYSDYVMKSSDGEGAAGVCHKRGSNQDLPSCWLIYITVEDLDKSLQACKKMGGEILREPKSCGGYGRFSIIRDPSGAAAALIEPA